VLDEAHEFGSAYWSEELNMVYYVDGQGNLAGWDPVTQSKLTLIYADEKLRELGASPIAYQSSGDGAYIFMGIENDLVNVYKMSVDGRSTELLISLPESRLGNTRPQVEGSRFYYTMYETEADVWVMSLDDR
jgi:hypothetical protein